MNPVSVIVCLGGVCALAVLVGWAVGHHLNEEILAFIDEDGAQP